MSGAVAVCVLALKAFSWPHLDHWKGLPAGCTMEAVGKVFTVPDREWKADGYIGDPPRTLDWLWVTGGGFPDSVRVWLDGGKVQLLETQVMGTPADLDAIVKQIGAPAAKLDVLFSNALLPGGEWVYPKLGLSLVVETENHNLLRVNAYPVTTLDEYRKKYRPAHKRVYR
jgi:hypothetical protein